MLTFFKIVSLLVLVGAIFLTSAYFADANMKKAVGRVLSAIAAVLALAIVAVVVFFGSAEVAPQERAVIQNSVTGRVEELGPGTFVWPFQPKLVPIVTTTHNYSLRNEQVNIGQDVVRQNGPTGVEADSNSPGRPTVYFVATGQFRIAEGNLARLHISYGPEYVERWVKPNWVSTIKAVQGGHTFDYFGNNRLDMQEEVQKKLQGLLVVDGEVLVVVSQVIITNYDYSAETNTALAAVVNLRLEEEKSRARLGVNRANQAADTVQVETTFIVTKRTAEAEQAKRIAEAEGQGQAVERLAKAEAFQITAKSEAQARAVQVVQAALAQSPDAYVRYLVAAAWNGELPRYMLGGVVPFLSIPTEPESTTTP